MDAVATGTLLGGIGLFLLGMNLMTDTLSSLGGNALRRMVKRVIVHRWSALATGALTTALLQSSSATTLITVGFVSAGLVTFSESLGLILGANIGTTSTGWIVSLVGLKLKIGTIALPLVGVGALIKLFSRGRRARFGLALSGFGLVFVGIDVMQQGMAGLDIDLTWGGGLPGVARILSLVLIGLVMTVLMQSSSAAVATTLVALDAGRIDLDQAAALVVGQNVGTTVTAILGAAGGALSARRTAVAHTLFNVLTACVALLLLRPFVDAVSALGRRWLDDSPESAIALFHTAFNVIGVALVYPWLDRFSALVEKIVPAPARAGVELPRSTLTMPAVALEAARRATITASVEALHVALAALRAPTTLAADATLFDRAVELARDPRRLLVGEDDKTHALAEHMAHAQDLLTELTTFIAMIRSESASAALRDEHMQLLRAVDHARRLLAVGHSEDRRGLVETRPELRALADPVLEALAELADEPDRPDAAWLARAVERAEACTKADDRRREAHRAEVMVRIADGRLSPDEGAAELAAARWIGKTPKHFGRALGHLLRISATVTPGASPDDDLDD